MKNGFFYAALGLVLIFLVGACGQTGVRTFTRTRDTNLPRPSRILVYNFAVSEDEVKEYQGVLRQQPSIKDPAVREREIGRHVAEALAVDLADGLRDLGFKVDRVGRAVVATSNDLLIDGQFINVDEGDRLKRLVIGFGSGASRVDTQVQVYQGEQRQKLLAFTTHSDSGKLPGAAVTTGASAAVTGGVSAGMVVGTTTMAGLKAYRSEVERMAGYSAEQVVRYLSEFFAKQGWIRPDQVKKARIAH